MVSSFVEKCNKMRDGRRLVSRPEIITSQKAKGASEILTAEEDGFRRDGRGLIGEENVKDA
jgi:hypothetical protein